MKPIEIVFDRLLHTDGGQIFISVILGFGFAALFKRVCKGNNCIVIRAPPMEEVIQNIYTIDGECFKYTAVPTKCVESADKKTQ